MIFGKRYKISLKKKEELEKELVTLETKGREDIASRLEMIRQQPIDEDDYPFADVFEDKEYLEQRIIEIKEILNNSSVLEEDAKHTVVEIGSKVTVGFDNFKEEYTIVTTLEADPLNKKISDESPIGKSLMGAKIGDTVTVQLGPVTKKFRIIKIN